MSRRQDGGDKRAEGSAAEGPRVADGWRGEGRADGTAQGRREIDPAKGRGGKGAR